MKYRVRFEPEVVEARDPDKAVEIVKTRLLDRHPEIRKIEVISDEIYWTNEK